MSLTPRIPRPAFYGWAVLAAAAFSAFMSGPAQTYGVSVFIDPMLADTGWSRSLVSTLYSLATLAGAFTLVVVGRSIDAKGARRVMLGATVLFAGGLFLAGAAIHPIMLFAGFALMRSFGSGSLGLACKTMIPNWFEVRRGRAFSVLGIAAALSLAIFPLFGSFLIRQLGWRHAWFFDAGMILIVLLPVVYLVIHNRPSDVGQLPDGREAPKEKDDPTERSAEEDSWTVRQATRDRTFWLLILAGIVPSLVGTGLAFNQVSILNSRGFTSELAASTFTVQSLISVPVMFLAGFLVERIRPRFILAASQVAMAIALVVLLAAHSLPMVLIFAGARGLSTGLWSVAADMIWPAYYGRRYLGSIRGMTFSTGIIGAAIGPLPLSYAFDILGSYNAAIAGMIILPAAGTIAILLAKPPKPRK